MNLRDRLNDEVGASGRYVEDTPLDYAGSGVDIDAEGLAVSKLIGALSNSIRLPGTKGAPVPLSGGFGGIIEFGDSCLALATDGVGSKLQLANALGKYDGVGIDCVAMNVNDLLCVGAEPLAFVDYIAVPRTDPDTHATIGASLAEACRRARITLAGGETATLPGIVTELDLSGTALGWFPAGQAITGENLEEGDVVIGLPSSGVHSNGYTLLRAVVEKSGLSLKDKAPFEASHPGREIEDASESGVTLGEILLNPTRIYVDPVFDLIESCRKEGGPCSIGDLKAIAHITGGGLSNLLRLHKNFGWHISNPLPPPPEFRWLAENGPIEKLEMHRVFNMGMGMCIAVSANVAEAVEKWLTERLPGTRKVGFVTDGGHRVTHTDPEIIFEHY